MEKDLIPKLGIKYIPITIYGFTKNVFLDFKNIFCINLAIKKCRKIMEDFKPDVVIGVGGYVTYPVLKAAKKLTKSECELIIKGSNEIIKEAIKMGGTTIKSYTSSLGVTGRFQQKLKVHKKAGEPCPECGSPIKNVKIGGRSTYFCEKCQK